jgi:hypothetical protein
MNGAEIAFGDGLTVFYPKGIGLADGTADDGVALGGVILPGPL